MEMRPRLKQAIPILMYHQVAELPEPGVPCRDLVTPPRTFARQMKLLSAMGYRGLSMRDLEPYVRGDATGRVVGITMDDGYSNCFENALPVLSHYGFTATCYVVSNRVGQTNAWDNSLGVPEQPIMNVEQLKGWIAAGQDIGGHTRNHPYLRQCDDATARDEIHGCKQDLERMLDAEVRHFSYPFGDYGPQHVVMVRETGFKSATTNTGRRATHHDEAHTLPRLTMLNDTGLFDLWSRVSFGFEDARQRVKSLRGLLGAGVVNGRRA